MHLSNTQTTFTLSIHAVIVQQQPQSACEGLQNLLTTSLPTNFICNGMGATNCRRIKCSYPRESLMLSLLPSSRAITIVVTANNSTTLLIVTLYSMPSPQSLSYQSLGDKRNLNVSVEVVASDGKDYYIVMLESSFGLEFPLTAIPLITTTGI